MTMECYVTLRDAESLAVVERISQNEMPDVLSLYAHAEKQCGGNVLFESNNDRWWLVTEPRDIRYILLENAGNFAQTANENVVLKRFLGAGVLTATGQTWKSKRSEMACNVGALPRGRLADEIQLSVAGLCDRWAAAEGNPLDIQEEMRRLAMHLVARCFFNVDIGAWENDLVRAIQSINAYAYASAATAEFPDELHAAFDTFQQACRWIAGAVSCPITGRRAPLLGEAASTIPTLLFTGFDTCSSLLTWTWHLLTQRPDVLEHTAREAVEVGSDKPLSLAEIDRLNFSEMVVEEVLRLYPPIWSFGRRSLTGDTVGTFQVPAGALVIICPYLTHRNPRYWKMPDAFEPTRFSADQRKERPRFAYLPFGAGERSCVAPGFARFQAKLVTSLVARAFRLSAVGPQVPKPLAQTTLNPSQPVWAMAQRRFRSTVIGTT